MIFSALKGFFILTFVGILGVIASYLSEIPGGINLVYRSEEFRFSFLAAIVTLIILIVVIFFFFKVLIFLSAVLSFFRGDETAIKRFFERSREKRGLKAFSNALIALEEKETDKALSEAKKAERLLSYPQMTALLGSRASKAGGLIASEKEYNKKLLRYPETRLSGLQGLINSSIEDGDLDTALALAFKAKELNPKNSSIAELLFSLQCRNKDWEGAYNTISENYKKKQNLTGEQLRRKEAVVLTAAAKESQLNGQSDKSIYLARQALKKSPKFIPGIIVCSELEHLIGKKTTGVKIVKTAWSNEPHPLLASVYASFFPDETPENRLDRFQPLLRKLESIEAAIVSANLHIAVEDFPKARSVLVNFTTGEIDSRIATLMAAAEKGCGEEERVVSGWLAKVTTAKRPPEWVCGQCGHIESWKPICSKCDSFDSQVWKSPSSSTEIHHGLASLPFVLKPAEYNVDNSSGIFSKSTVISSEEETKSKSSGENILLEDAKEEKNIAGKDRRKEKVTSEIADNARKII